MAGRGYRFAVAVSETDTQALAAPRAADADTALPVNGGASGQLSLALPDRPSIAVLPFDNLGSEPGQEHFIDGVTEDIITELSRFRSLFVIARNSTFSYKGKAIDVRTIAKELGVRYVVEGAIRQASNRIRVTAQLIDAISGSHVWAERYDRVLENIFALQEELTRSIVAAIAPQIESSEFQKVRGARPGNVNAYALAMRARDAARRADKEAESLSRDEALALAARALAIDAHCGTALTTIAYLHWRHIWAGITATPGDLAESADAGLTAARRAIAIDGGDHLAHLWKGMILLFYGQHSAGLADLRRAHDLNPNDALTLSLLGQCLAGAGEARAGVEYASAALRLSPRDALRWSFLNSLAWAHFAAGEYAQAAQAAQQAIDEAPKFAPAHLCLVVSRVGLGEAERCTAGVQLLRDLAPSTLAARLAGRWHYADTALAQRATAFLRIAAGLQRPNAPHAPR